MRPGAAFYHASACGLGVSGLTKPAVLGAIIAGLARGLPPFGAFFHRNPMFNDYLIWAIAVATLIFDCQRVDHASGYSDAVVGVVAGLTRETGGVPVPDCPG